MSSLHFALFGYLFSRAWIGVAFSSGLQGIGHLPVSVGPDALMNVFDWSLIATYLAGVFLSRRLAPLACRKGAVPVGVLLMTGGTALVVGCLAAPVDVGLLPCFAIAICGVGYALLFLQWAEIYGLCSPPQVALVFSGAKIAADLLVFVLNDHSAAFLALFALGLPLLSGVSLKASRTHFDRRGERVRVQWKNASLPWKPLMLMGIFGFAYGFGMEGLPRVNSFASTVATDLPALLVCVSAVFSFRKFDFSLVYNIAFPVLIIGCFVLPIIPGMPSLASSVCLRMSYVCILIIVTVVLANFSHRYRISAMWLFGLQGFVHYLSIVCGKGLHDALAPYASLVPFDAGLLVMGISAAIIAFVLLTERSLLSDWKLSFSNQDDASFKENQLSRAIAEAGKEYGLPPREQEVLDELARGKNSREIAEALYLAQGTVKAHIQHIYRKFGIASRDELAQLLERFVAL